MQKVEDVNGTGRADVIYFTRSCGAHTCWDRLYIVEWDGAGFVNRIPDLADFPHAAFSVGDGRVVVDAGGIGSVGAGYQRSYQEIWEWDGRQFTLTEQVVGPSTALMHYIHDGDAALAQGDYGDRGLSWDFFAQLVEDVKECADRVSEGRYLVGLGGGSRYEIADYITPKIIEILTKF